MKKFLVILMVVAMASFLFVGCMPSVTPPVDDEEDEEEEVVPVAEAPIITRIVGINIVSDDTEYINIAESGGVIVWGVAEPYSVIKIYIDDEHVATDAPGILGVFGATVIATDNLGDDGEKTIYATATLIGLDESAHSIEYEFTLDTERPAIDIAVANKGDSTVTVTMTEAVDEDTAEDPLNWYVDEVPLAGVVNMVVDAELTADDEVEIDVSTIGFTNFGVNYLVSCLATATAVEDLAGNPLTTQSDFSGVVIP